MIEPMMYFEIGQRSLYYSTLLVLCRLRRLKSGRGARAGFKRNHIIIHCQAARGYTYRSIEPFNGDVDHVHVDVLKDCCFCNLASVLDHRLSKLNDLEVFLKYLGKKMSALT